MKIYGLDFTSAPSRKKPITCAAVDLQEGRLHVEDCLELTSFEDFEALLGVEGRWLAALGFGFGQTDKLIPNLGQPETWEGYMPVVASIGKRDVEEALRR